ncbi:YCII-related domain protein [Caulifigura coniformis]|uniref:YCII-related domain protein n=1 Tax=Caulifigura coniformis TaxID=2527983 RepID=A0A517S8P6_9PLAN|nr:YciI family protein [Caulifigura coniformis]QDT52498.1 YCII-related domain protein [Caulifigura coniformis]
MRFMILRKSDDRTESGLTPPPEMIAAMGQYKAAMQAAGVYAGGDGLLSSSAGARVHYRNGQVSVIDGPFSETKEMIAGFVVVDVESLEEAAKWASMCPSLCGPGEAVMEIRQVYQASDFPAAQQEMIRQLPWETVANNSAG